ncbi:GNAT family N-acetyltransferase [Marinomonas transparens]|uniref:GNAT family N-acetyltransferase n=1 Tax=Marinomonas transparens TaxID=2795388 RepID=A0A934JS09_9GAMM|nr:GNAT family N-acetyltransferase [Marinomonas transparens]MBJ7536254.1 GNAT family N-acetyltransferase [Marinomonas transparens]
MEIRKIKSSDAANWSALRIEFLPEIKDISQAEVKAFFAGNNPNTQEVFVATSATKQFIGFIELNIRSNVPGSAQQETPYIEAWFVSPKYQGQGIGKRLIQAAEHWAIEQGFQELASDAQISNEKSICLHKKQGFKEIERIACLLKSLN